MRNQSSARTLPTRGRRSSSRQWRGLLAAAALTLYLVYAPQAEPGEPSLRQVQAAHSDTSHIQHGPAGRSYLRDFATDTDPGRHGPAGRSYLSYLAPAR